MRYVAAIRYYKDPEDGDLEKVTITLSCGKEVSLCASEAAAFKLECATYEKNIQTHS